jgi:hypothetical protein
MGKGSQGTDKIMQSVRHGTYIYSEGFNGCKTFFSIFAVLYGAAML